MSKNRHCEGLRAARFFMVMSSISPLFIFWAIRGNSLIPDYCFISFCAVMVILPNVFLWWRVIAAIRLKEKRSIVVGMAEDHREHLLIYLFAMLLPFYSINLGTWRDLIAALVAISFIIFLFWHLNLHYMNLIFAMLGYRVFTIYPPADDNPLSGRDKMVLITRRVSMFSGRCLYAYRLSDTVYLEADT